MHDDSLHHLLSAVDAPAAPRPEFADALLATLLEELDDQPVAQRSPRPARPGPVRRLFGGRFVLIAATLGAFALVASLLVQTFAPLGREPSPRPPARISGVTATIPAGDAPVGIVDSDQAVWIGHRHGNQVWRLDGASHLVTARITVGTREQSGPIAVAAGAGGIWAANVDEGTVARIDPSSNRLVTTVTVGDLPSAILVHTGRVWVADRGDRTVSVIDPGTNRVVARIPVGGGPTALAAGAGSIWVANSVDGTVSRIDPGSATVTGTFDAGSEPSGLAFTGSSLWIIRADATVARIDPGTGAAVAVFPLPGRPASVTANGRSLFVTSNTANEVWQIDVATGEIVARIATGTGAIGVALEQGVVWVTNELDGTVSAVGFTTG
jgi:YVTN family beta-propeller protein